MQHQESSERPKQLQMWYSHDCKRVHLRTDNVCLTFSGDEFTQLSEAVLDIYRTEIDWKIDSALQKADQDDVLESDLIG